jgi:hypothetical protein
LQIGIPEFIAIWLGIKTAGGWKHWTKEHWYYTGDDGKEIKIIGRNAFNVFLVAQALSIGFAAIGWKLIEWLNGSARIEAVAVGVSVLIGATILWMILRFNIKREVKKILHKIISRLRNKD